MRLELGAKRSVVMHLAGSHQWYDFSVSVVGETHYLRRFAGRVETGKSGFSDPAMS
jgi:phospholipase C